MHERGRFSGRRAALTGACTVILAGLALILYPFLADYTYAHRTEGLIRAIDQVREEQEGPDPETESMLKSADLYNQRLRERVRERIILPEQSEPDAEYDSLLSFDSSGVMGYISVPCIGVRLPLYHGSTDAILEKGAGHLYGSSLPVGGEGTHAVITAHTGMGRARFFTDLVELEEGDLFMISVPGRCLYYRVDQINVVLPGDCSKLVIEDGKDYCTLLTCTPYGINSHRLLVRGERVADETVTAVTLREQREDKPRSEWLTQYLRSLLTALIVAAGAGTALCISRRLRK